MDKQPWIFGRVLQRQDGKLFWKKNTEGDILAWCYRERGRVYKALKQYKKAEKDFLTAFPLNPNIRADLLARFI
ncbi:tetratricopeptide repeat protein [Candidatus Avelusimicrobium facis]|uniref:tetratricopeptide repeat protein n=1 Tax=Candidatus Avelusimicrobium facis TaxID=3416203 RepID=UPI003D12B1B4